jgi:ankyrin repeat protein
MNSNQTANLIRAIKNDHEEEFMNILEKEDIDIHKKDSEIQELENDFHHIRIATPIVIASDVGNVKIVKALILKGANIHDTDANGLNSLMRASIYCNVDVIKLLLLNGANINEKNLLGNNATAILYASLHSQKEPIQLLLAEGASIHDKTIDGSSCFTVTYNNNIKSIFVKWLARQSLQACHEVD